MSSGRGCKHPVRNSHHEQNQADKDSRVLGALGHIFVLKPPLSSWKRREKHERGAASGGHRAPDLQPHSSTRPPGSCAFFLLHVLVGPLPHAVRATSKVQEAEWMGRPRGGCGHGAGRDGGRAQSCRRRPSASVGWRDKGVSPCSWHLSVSRVQLGFRAAGAWYGTKISPSSQGDTVTQWCVTASVSSGEPSASTWILSKSWHLSDWLSPPNKQSLR